MPPSNPSSDASGDEGAAALEFILVGMLLLVPLVYLVISLGQIQGQTLGAESGARHIARAIATADGAADADARATATLGAVAEAYGIDPSAVEVSLSCVSHAASCPEAGATLVVTVRTRVTLPLIPPVLGLDRLASIPVEASSAQKVSRFWGAG